MLKKWCEVTSCNGVIDLYESRHNLKCAVFWAFVILIMTVGTVWFTYRTIDGYIQTPYVTNVNAVTQSELTMPEVMVCFQGGLNASAMQSESWSDNLIVDTTLTLKDIYYPWRPESKQEYTNYSSVKNVTFKNVLEKFSYNCEDMVEELRFANRVVKNHCQNVSDFITSTGKCYIFRNLSNQYYPGIDGGIELVLKTAKQSFYDVYSQEAKNSRITNDFSITLEHTFGLQRTARSFAVAKNHFVDFTLNTKRYVRLTGSDTCEPGPEFYSSNTCYFTCYTKGLYKYCGCYHYDYWDELKIEPGTTICDPFTQSYCNANFDLEGCKLCQMKCKPKCDEWIYEVTTTYSPLDSNDNVSIVRIGYNTMQYTRIDEVQAFSIDMAIANVGGQAGLWLGASFVTIIQALYYLCLSFFQRNSKQQDVKWASRQESDCKR